MKKKNRQKIKTAKVMAVRCYYEIYIRSKHKTTPPSLVKSILICMRFTTNQQSTIKNQKKSSLTAFGVGYFCFVQFFCVFVVALKLKCSVKYQWPLTHKSQRPTLGRERISYAIIQMHIFMTWYGIWNKRMVKRKRERVIEKFDEVFSRFLHNIGGICMVLL